MSRALDYLLKQRPEAMGAYFKFLKDAGSRLDPKTRALISVITKVAAQTDKGLVQYTKKALNEDVSAEEILDALLMAFPALGLSKIVWAVEVLISAGIPGFDEAAEALTEPPAAATREWIDAANFDALPQARAIKYSAPGRALLLYREGARVRAFKAYCSHQGMELMEHGIEADRVVCMMHGWTFDMPDGRCSRGESWNLPELETEVRDGRVMVCWRD